MTKDELIDSHALEVNYLVNRCFGEETSHDWAMQKWSRSPRADRYHSWVALRGAAPSLVSAARFGVHEPTSRVVHSQNAPTDPVRLAVEILAGSGEVRRREYLDRQIKAAVAAAISAREEFVLSRETQQQARASAMVQNLLERLREKTKDVSLPAPDEAWRLVDFSAFDDEE